VGPKGTGFVLQGKYPDFYWEETDGRPKWNWKQDNQIGDLYDEDIPQ